MKGMVRGWLRPLLLAALPLAAAAQDQRFDIHRFQVEGNTLLAPAHVEALVAPFTGPKRVYGDIQKALEALENAYRASGYGTVQVYVPEQELDGGIVRLQVTEGVVGTVTVSGNKHFDEANIRRTLPDLREGKAPNMRVLSENVQLANENPAKQIELVLGTGEKEGTVDAKVNVTDENPRKFVVTADNTGTEATGKHRIGVAYQNANLNDSDQVLTLAYTSSPDKPDGVKVDIYSVAFRQPLYGIGDSIDVIYGKSSVNTPIVQATGFNLSGKGDVFALRWNHYFPRRGEYTSKLIGGFDYKYIATTCTINGVPTPIDPPAGGGISCTPYTLRPVSLTYAGQRTGPGRLIDYSLGYAQNLFPMGSFYNYTTLGGTQGTDRYTMVAGGRQTPDRFDAWRLTLNYLRALPEEWAIRFGLNAQYSRSALPSPEQIGLAGAAAVRGFNESAVRMDKGYFANVELYSPELSGHLGAPGSLKALAFYDFARGFNYGTVRPSPTTTPVEKAGLGSLGLGLRYAMAKDFSLRADLARVMDAGPVDVSPSSGVTPTNTESRGDWRGHFSMQLAF